MRKIKITNLVQVLTMTVESQAEYDAIEKAVEALTKLELLDANKIDFEDEDEDSE